MSITALAVFAVYFLGLILGFLRHPIYALFSYVWIYYNHPPMYWWGSDLPELRYSLFAAVVAFVAALRLENEGREPWYRSTGIKLILIYAIWMWVQTPWAVNIDAHIEGAVLATKFFILTYIIYGVLVNIDLLRSFLWMHFAGCVLFGWIGFTTDVRGRLESIGAPGIDDGNLVAAHMITGVVIGAFLFLSTKKWYRWLGFAGLPLILNAIILTQSRGALVALVCSMPVAIYLAPAANRKIVLIGVVVGIVGFLGLANDDFWMRAQTIFGGGEEASQETRVHLIGPQFQMFLDHPLGAGHRGNEFLSPFYIPPEFMADEVGRRSAHNTFMAALVDQGFPGAVMLIGLYVWGGILLVRMRRLDKQGLPIEIAMLRAGIGTALWSCLISGLFLNLLKTEVQVWLLAALAVLWDLGQRALKEGSPKKVKSNSANSEIAMSG